MLLEELSYVEVEGYLTEKDIILIPIGSVEQHSPYGLLGTDFITAEEIAREVGKRMDIIVAPTLCYGMSQHHMAFPGSITLTPKTLLFLIKDVVNSLLDHGFKRIVFINGHGGNINTVNAAFEELKAEGKSGIFQIISWFLLPEIQDIEKALFGDKNGYHATPSEVSITKYLRSEAFKTKAKIEKEVETVKSYWPLNRYEFKKLYPDGRMNSAPWLAKEKYGKIILEEAVRVLEERIKDIIKMKVIE